MCSIRHQNTEELVLWHHIAAFRRRFAGVSQCFADVSRMFRGCFAGRFARFARVSRMFRKNSRHLRAVNPCRRMAAPRVERFQAIFASDLERFWREIWTLHRADFLRCLSDFERSAGRQLVEQAGERLGSISIDNILLSERLSKYWRNICHPTDMPYVSGHHVKGRR